MFVLQSIAVTPNLLERSRHDTGPAKSPVSRCENVSAQLLSTWSPCAPLVRADVYQMWYLQSHQRQQTPAGVLSILTHVQVSGSKLKRRSNLQIVVCSFVT